MSTSNEKRLNEMVTFFPTFYSNDECTYVLSITKTNQIYFLRTNKIIDKHFLKYNP